MRFSIPLAGAAAALVLFACSDGGAGAPAPTYDFVSSLPGFELGTPRDGEPAVDAGGEPVPGAVHGRAA